MQDVVSILDNGSGMDAASLQDFATFALDPESRGVYRSDSSSTNDFSQVQTGLAFCLFFCVLS